MGFQPGIEVIKHHARFDRDGLGVCIKGNYVAQPFTVVDDQRVTDRLTTLTRARTTRQHGYLLIACNIQRP